MVVATTPPPEEPVAQQSESFLHVTASRAVIPVGSDSEIHLAPASVVASTAPLEEFVMEPAAQQSDLFTHETLSRLPRPLGTD